MTVATSGTEAVRPRPWRPTPLATGLAVWALGFVVLPASLAARIVLLAPLVVVPRLLAPLADRPMIRRIGGWPALIAALPLLASFAMPAGVDAAVFALPWLMVAVLGAAGAIAHGVTRLRSILRPVGVPDLGVDVALGFLAVAATFVVIDRLGLSTPFPAVIVLLTAIHFHFAGFGLLGLASLMARNRPWLRASVIGLVVGIPLTAVGFVTSSNAVNAVGALIVGSSGIGVAIALLGGRTRTIAERGSKLAGLALLVGMPMGIAWSVSILTGFAFIDLDAMIRTHGALNATAVLIAVITFRPPAREIPYFR